MEKKVVERKTLNVFVDLKESATIFKPVELTTRDFGKLSLVSCPDYNSALCLRTGLLTSFIGLFDVRDYPKKTLEETAHTILTVSHKIIPKGFDGKQALIRPSDDSLD